MRHLQFQNKPSSFGSGIVLPNAQSGSAGYYPIVANAYIHLDDFLDTAIDTAEWADGSSLGTGAGALPTVANNFLTHTTPTSTGGVTLLRTSGTYTAGGNIYNVPFRVLFNARISVTAGAGISPTGGLDYYLGVRDTSDSHIAQFHLDCSTAGSSSLAAPIINMETRQGSTAAAFINSAAATIFSSAFGRTATMVTGYMLEVTHRGVAFGLRDPVGNTEPQLLAYFGAKIPRIDKNYQLDIRTVARGSAGYSQSAGISFEVDNVTVEQFAPDFIPMNHGSDQISKAGGVRSAFMVQALGSVAAGLVTSGSGTFFGYSAGCSATAGLDLFMAVWDASAGSSSVYDFVTIAGATAGTPRLLWYAQVGGCGPTGGEGTAPGVGGQIPAQGIPFQRGLIVGAVDPAILAKGSTALNILVSYRGAM